MKKLFVLFMALPLLFVACGDNNNDDPGKDGGEGTEASIVGTWATTSTDMEIESTQQGVVDMMKELFETSNPFEDLMGQNVTFNADGTTFSDAESEGKYTFNGSTLSITDSVELENGETVTLTTDFDVVLSGDNMTLTMDVLEVMDTILPVVLPEDLPIEIDLDALGLTKLNFIINMTRE